MGALAPIYYLVIVFKSFLNLHNYFTFQNNQFHSNYHLVDIFIDSAHSFGRSIILN